MGVKVEVGGDFNNLERFLNKIRGKSYLNVLDEFGREGVSALASATPIDSGTTANAWSYEIHYSKGSVEIDWTNSNIQDGVNIAVILQYGHGTGTGAYIQGRDYINPALRPVFNSIADRAWKAVVE